MYGVFKFEYVVEMLKNKKHNKGCFGFVEIFLNVIFAHTFRGVA